MKRDWRPTLALIAALLFSFGLTWMGREVGAHVARDAELIAQLTMHERPLRAVRFARPPLPIDARNVDASASDAGTSDAYEATDLAAPVIRRYCDALVNRICLAWTECGCEGTPRLGWAEEVAEPSTCEERGMRACEAWHSWDRLRDGLSHPTWTVDPRKIAQLEAHANNDISCSGANLRTGGSLINDAVVGERCEEPYGCRDESTCIDDVCTVLPTHGEPCLNEWEDDPEHDPCLASGLCAEGLVCARHRCAPSDRFDCGRFSLSSTADPFIPCPLGQAYSWDDQELRHLRTLRHLTLENMPTPRCRPIGRLCTRDAECLGQCTGAHTRVCMPPMLYELRREPELPLGFVDDGQHITAQVGEDCQHRRCGEGLSCSWFSIERDASFEIGYVCREPVGEGLECSVDSDCTEGLLCGNRYEAGRCEPHLCHADPIFQ